MFCFTKVVHFLWGEISLEEAKKFAFLSAIFFFIIGSYWMMRELKNALFMNIVGPTGLPYAKMVSLVSITLLVLFYNKLIDWFERTNLIYIITSFFAILYFAIAYFAAHPTIGIGNTQASKYRLFGWFLYVAVEAFGSIVVSLFWAYVASIMDTASAKKGYPLILAGAQLGSILGSVAVMTLPQVIGVPILFGIAAGLVLIVPFLIRIFSQKYKQQTMGTVQEKKATGIFEGLRLIGTKPYLMGILVVSITYEIIITILEYQMNFYAKQSLGSIEKVASFLGMQGVAVNSISFIFALVGTSFFIRKFGLTTCLILYPLSIAGFVLYAWSLPTLYVFLVCVVGIKGLSYALNNPCKEIMYIPTSKDVKFKAKGWVDAFGGRTSKSIGSMVNALFPVLSELLVYGSIISLGVIAAWIPVAWYVGTTNSKLVQENKLIE
jgi:ATP:ADP antiporter, AAA family